MYTDNRNNKLSEIINSDEYIQNKMQIDCIKDVLVNHSDVPEKLVDWLIDAVEKNTTLVSEAKLSKWNLKLVIYSWT